jgi:hypothetical protein
VQAWHRQGRWATPVLSIAERYTLAYASNHIHAGHPRMHLDAVRRGRC